MSRGWIALGSSVLAACAGAPERHSVVVHDSAGIRLMTYPAGFEDALPSWQVDSVPLVDIGGRQEPGHDLHQVAGATRLDDGRIVVINRSSGELRFYDSTGRYLASAGRLGQGPGEFSSFVSSVQVLPGDTILVNDLEQRRGSLLSPNGVFIRTIPNRWGSGPHSLAAIALLRGGRFLAEERLGPKLTEASGPARRDSFAIVQVGPSDGRVDTIRVVPGTEVYPATGSEGGLQFPTLVPLEFGRRTEFATDGRRIVVATNETDEFQVYDHSGKVVLIVRTAARPVPVTEQDRDARRHERLAMLEQRRSLAPQLRDALKKMVANARYAEAFPYYERILLGTDDTFWLERPRRTSSENRRFVVYDSSGRAVARVVCPGGIQPYHIGPSAIIGLWRDAEDVQHVRSYPIRRT